jgi:hypothetical protein
MLVHWLVFVLWHAGVRDLQRQVLAVADFGSSNAGDCSQSEADLRDQRQAERRLITRELPG